MDLPSIAGLPDLWLLIDHAGALDGTCVRRDRDELGPDGSTSRFWLVHARSGYAAINFSIENTVPRDNM